MSRAVWIVLAGCIAFGAMAAGYTRERSDQCERRGGVLVRSAAFGYACVAPVSR